MNPFMYSQVVLFLKTFVTMVAGKGLHFWLFPGMNPFMYSQIGLFLKTLVTMVAGKGLHFWLFPDMNPFMYSQVVLFFKTVMTGYDYYQSDFGGLPIEWSRDIKG